MPTGAEQVGLQLYEEGECVDLVCYALNGSCLLKTQTAIPRPP